MEHDQNFPLIRMILLILCAAFFSAAETSLFSLSRFQLRQIKQRTPKIFYKIRHLLDRPAALVATVLLGNECANVLSSSLMANYYEKLALPSYAVIAINLATVIPLILLFGEITPKIIAAKANIKTAQKLLPALWIFYKLSLPIRFVLESIVNVFTKALRIKSKPRDNLKEEDFLILLEEGKNKGAIESAEQELIENIFEIDDDKALEISTPLRECLLIQQEEEIHGALEKLKKNFHPRVPVYGSSTENIVGILYAKDALKYLNREEEGVTVKNIMKDPLFVAANMKVEVLFKRLRQLKTHIAIIQDKNQKPIAVVTMEDILEQMFGELWEETE